MQTIAVKSEPCFRIITKEDEMAKQFYQNKSQIVEKQQDKGLLFRQMTPKKVNELEEQHCAKWIVRHV